MRGGARAHGPLRRDAGTGGGHDGPRRARRGRLLLLRRPRGRRSGRDRVRARARPGGARLRLLLRPHRAGAVGRPPRARVARLRPQPGRRRLGERAPARHPLRAQPRGAAAALRRRDVRLRLRDLDLEPLRRSERRSTGSTRCAACCGRADGSCSPPTESTRWHTPTASASARRSSWRRSAGRSTERGFWYTPEYEGIGDHGIANPDWGIAFLTAEWLLARATPRWRVALFHPGRVEANHDLYVLERR